MKYLSSSTTHRIDKQLTHPFKGVVIFLFLMWLMFYCTFTLGKYPQTWIEDAVNALSVFTRSAMAEGEFRDLLVDGIINGLGSIIVFLPNILILFLFIAVFEETGYMARAAQIMDKYMHKIGLHGQSFLPLIMGFGCNVPAILATNIIPERNYRLLTMLINPFMSCSARLPVYILLIGAFFPSKPVWVLIFLYSLGIFISVLTALILKKFLITTPANLAGTKHKLPPYKQPSLKRVLRFLFEKSLQYLKKISGVVLLAVIIIWALNYFPKNTTFSKDYAAEITTLEHLIESNTDHTIQTQIKSQIHELHLSQNAEVQAHSYLGRLGQFIEPVMRPLGFDWKMSIALLSGLPAKEFVVSTLGVIYQVEDSDENSIALINRLQNETYTSGSKMGQKTFNSAVALSFLVFVLLYFPCVASIAAIKKESGSWKWAVFSVVYTTSLAWVVSFVVYRLALFFI